MKQLFAAIFILFLVSCSKEDLTAPKTASIQTSSPISYRSSNIAISSFQAKAVNSDITISFSTSFQKDVKTLEILRGYTSTSLCSIYKTDGNVSSGASLQYTTSDTESASTVYYIVKYTLTNSDWGYTPIFTLQKGQTD